MLKISIYGIGNFGFALLKHLSKKTRSNDNITLYAYDINEELIRHLREKRKHLFLHTNIKINKEVNIVDNVKQLIENVYSFAPNMDTASFLTSPAALEIIWVCEPYEYPNPFIIPAKMAITFLNAAAYSTPFMSLVV